MQTVLIAANWKMFKVTSDAAEFFRRWRGEDLPTGSELAFFPPYPLLQVVRDLLRGESLGAQNCHEADEGAFTGEVSCKLLRDLGCRYVLVGHSERRHVFGEGDPRLALKFQAALKHGLRPILCVGERLEEREAGRTLAVVEGQLAGGLGTQPPADGFDVAYEPVWAIGTGKVAHPEDADQVHRAIRSWLDGRGSGKDCRILYGGSVKPENAGALLAVPSIRGLLVGGASLDAAGFAAIGRAGK